MTDTAMINAMGKVVAAARKWANDGNRSEARNQFLLSLLLMEVQDLEHLERARAVYFASTNEPL